MAKKREDPFDPKFAINQPRAGESQSIDSGGAIAASPAEDGQSEALTISQTESLTAAQEKALAALQKCLVAIQNKIRSAYAEVQLESNGTRRAQYLKLSIERLKRVQLDSILESEKLKLPSIIGPDGKTIVGFNLSFSSVQGPWNEVKNTVEQDTHSQYPELAGRKLKKLVDQNVGFYKTLLGNAVVNTLASSEEPNLKEVVKSQTSPSGAEGETNEGVEKATSAAAGINEERQDKAEKSFGKRVAGFLSRVAISTTLAILLGTPILTTLLISLPLGMFAGFVVNRIGLPEGWFKFGTKIALSVILMICLGGIAHDFIVNPADKALEAADPELAKQADSLWKPFGDFLQSLRDSARSAISDTASIFTGDAAPTSGATATPDTSSTADAQPSPETTPAVNYDTDPALGNIDPRVQDQLLDGEIKHIFQYDPETRTFTHYFVQDGQIQTETLPSSSRLPDAVLVDQNGQPSMQFDTNGNMTSYKAPIPSADDLVPKPPVITPDPIRMPMPWQSDATPTATAEVPTAPAEPAPTETAPAPAENTAPPTTDTPAPTGGETVAPPAEIGPVFAGGNEGMVSILERLREQVQQAAAQGVVFPEGSLADQLLKADSQADLIKIAQDNGWFSTATDTAGTPDSVVIYENDQFAINDKGDLVAPKDFASRGMTDTGDYTPKGTVQRS